MRLNYKNFFITIALLIGITFTAFISNNKAKASDENSFSVSTITRSHELVSEKYLEAYSITNNNQEEIYITNVNSNAPYYGQNKRENAVDGNFNTFWETNKVNTIDFKNEFVIELNKETTINRLVFATRRDGSEKKGFPLEATFYISNDGIEYTKIGVGKTSLTDKVLLYTFDKNYTFKFFKFEYTDINPELTKHASASEFILLKPEEKEVVAIRNLFSDYKKSIIKEEYNDIEVINNLRELVIDNPIYETVLKDNLDRAESILENSIIFDVSNREFSTGNLTSKKIKQVGSIADFRRKLKHTWQGTDRQATGIFGNPGDEITVYVEANENDPLPQICFTQYIATYHGWQETKSLTVGENKFIVPNLYKDSYASYGESIPGGPIYLINPYTSDEQSQNVKIYIEGGEDFPIFYEGDNEYDFKDELANYLEKYYANREKYHNLCEIVSDNVILTIQATRADYFYNSKNYDVVKTCENWDLFIRSIHEFDGVTLNENDKYYDPRANYYNVNIRIMQPFGSAYAYTEHIGIQIGTWQDIAITGENLSWGYAHEIGHMLAMGEREIGEVTNNMHSQFNQAYLERNGARGNTNTFKDYFFSDDAEARKTYNDLPLIEKSLLWWNIEVMYPGYWGRLNNLYRYQTLTTDLNKIEKHVYFSSIATGVDMSYYFIRTGFDAWGKFDENNMSDNFKKLMKELKDNNTIKEEEKKLWYFDSMSATYNYEMGNELNIYSNDIAIDILGVSKESDGYLIILPNKGTQIAHLGYEIYEGTPDNLKLIAFTYGNTYKDSKTYTDGYIPSYYIKAIDRRLNSTKLSLPYTIADNTNNVCKINDTYYTSLKEAISKANDADTIYLLSDIKEDNIVIDKNITITIAENLNKNIIIYKLTNNPIFKVNANVTFTLKGNDNYKLVIDGNNTSLAGRIIYSNGGLNLDNIEVKNIISSTSDGGIIYNSSNGSVNISNSKFSNIKANGKGAILYNANASINLTNTIFDSNSANDGGAFYSLSANIKITDCSFINNSAKTGGVAVTNNSGNVVVDNTSFINNKATSMGGVAFTQANWTITRSIFTGNISNGDAGVFYAQYMSNINLSECEINNNEAKSNGGVVFGNQYSVVGVTNCTIFDNKASKGNIIFMNQAYDRTLTIITNGNKMSGSIWIGSKHTINIKGSLDNLYLEIGTTKAIGQIVLNTEVELDDNFSKYFDLEFETKNKYSLELKENLKSLALIEGSYTINLEILDETKPYLEVKYNDNITLPTFDNNLDGYKFLYWQYNGKNYNPGENITIVGNYPIIAIFEQYKFPFIISTAENIVESSKMYQDGDKVDLNYLTFTITGKRITGWIYKGKVYDSNDTITFDSRYQEISPILTNTNKITVIINNESHVLNGEFLPGDIINLSDLEKQFSKPISAFIYNGIEYKITDSIVIADGVYTIEAILEDDVEEVPPTPSTPDDKNNVYIYIVLGVVVTIVLAGTLTFVFIKKRKN